jgi:serpin B
MRRTLLFSVAFFVVACSSTPTVAPPDKADTTAIVDGNTKFALDLYAKLPAQGNLFFAPYSISSALAMTYVGARGDTAKEMKTVLDFPADEQLHPAYRYLNWELNGDTGKKRGYQLSVANRLWGQKGYPWKKEFLDTTQKYYGAGIQDVDFRDDTEAARKTINDWVEKQTKDKIKELLTKGILTRDSRLVLTNAIYFKGDWASQFKKDRTHSAPFHVSADKTTPVPLMNQLTSFEYTDDRDVQVVKMPYVGKELEMVVILPKKVDGLRDVEKSLTPAKLKGWTTGTRTEKVDVTLPKFKVESGFDLKETLMALGMKTAFDDKTADLTGTATAEQLFIGAVIHKAFVEVGEEGTEAAGATAVIEQTKDGGGPRPAIFTFRADHPFLFLIRDSRSGAILFLGRYAGV